MLSLASRAWRPAAAAAALALALGGCSCDAGAPAGQDAYWPPDALPDAAPPLPIQLAWTRTVNAAGNTIDDLPSVHAFVLSDGTFYVVGSPQMVSYDPSGHELGRVAFPGDLGRHAVIHAAALLGGGVILAAFDCAIPSFGLRLRRYSPGLALASSVDVMPKDVVRRCELLPDRANVHIVVRATKSQPGPDPPYLQLYEAALPGLGTTQSFSEPGDYRYQYSNLLETPSGKLAFCGSIGPNDSRIYRVTPGVGVTAGASLGGDRAVCSLTQTPGGILAMWKQENPPCDWAALLDDEGEKILVPPRCVLETDRVSLGFRYVDGRLVAIGATRNGILTLYTIDMTGAVPKAGPVYSLDIPYGWTGAFVRVHDADIYLAFAELTGAGPRTVFARLCPFSNPRCYVPPPPADAAPPDGARADAATRDAGTRDAAPPDAAP